MKRFAVFLILLNGVFAFPPWMVSQATSATSKPDTASHDLLVLQTRIASQEPLTWVFTGDSVTQGALWTGGLRTYPEIFSERIRWEMHRNRDIIVNTAISGNKTADILQDFDWRIAHLHPDVVSLMIGMNDCTRGPEGEKAFEENLSQLIARIIVDPEKVAFRPMQVEFGADPSLAERELSPKCVSGGAEKCAKKLRGAYGSSSQQQPGWR
jgi:acyl-CoA thioesterase-1